MKRSILLVDDDRSMNELMQMALRQAGYRVHLAEDGSSALEILKHESVDLLLLDIQLPGLSGFKLLEIIKEDSKTDRLPVIMLTVLGDEAHKVRGLKGGADDYLAKPFSTKELLARIEALLRRTQDGGKTRKVLEAGDLSLDLDAFEASIKGRPVRLTKAEFDLLSLFVRRKGFVLTYQSLADGMSGPGEERIITPETIHTHIKNLRNKLGTSGRQIESIRGIGYKLRIR